MPRLVIEDLLLNPQVSLHVMEAWFDNVLMAIVAVRHRGRTVALLEMEVTRTWIGTDEPPLRFWRHM